MPPRHRCSRPSRRVDPERRVVEGADPLDYLGPDGALHPQLPALRCAEDACDALDLGRPDAFDDGLLVLLLDAEARPWLAVAAEHAPRDDIEAIAALLTCARDLGRPVAGVVLGIYRATRTVGSAAVKMTIDGSQLAAWVSLSRLLQEADITLVDVLVFEPGRWMSFVAATSGETYPSGPLPWPPAFG
jgi:hypothetical protein